MESNSNYKIAARSDEELRERIDNRQKYMPETVEASVAELIIRGAIFSIDELKVINEDIQMQRANAAITGRIGFFNNSLNNVIVKDPDAPLMYSRRVICTFSFFFGALFGAIMMSMNFRKLGKRKDAIYAILFGIGFTALQVFLVSSTNPATSGSYLILGGLVAAICLDFFFWKFHIGYETFYRARSIGAPLIIGILIWGSLLALLILAMYVTRY